MLATTLSIKKKKKKKKKKLEKIHTMGQKDPPRLLTFYTKKKHVMR